MMFLRYCFVLKHVLAIQMDAFNMSQIITNAFICVADKRKGYTKMQKDRFPLKVDVQMPFDTVSVSDDSY